MFIYIYTHIHTYIHYMYIHAYIILARTCIVYSMVDVLYWLHVQGVFLYEIFWCIHRLVLFLQ